MTSYDLKRILAEELARIVPGDAGKRRTKFDYVFPGFGERLSPRMGFRNHFIALERDST